MAEKLKPIIYEPYTAHGERGNPVRWIWDCPNCYASQADYPTGFVAKMGGGTARNQASRRDRSGTGLPCHPGTWIRLGDPSVTAYRMNNVSIKATSEGRTVTLNLWGTDHGGKQFTVELPMSREEFPRMIEVLCEGAGFPAPWKD